MHINNHKGRCKLKEEKGLATATIGRHALVWNPHALRGLAVLIKHINRNTSARVPIAANTKPFWAYLAYKTLANTCCASFVKITMVTVRPEKELEGFALDNPLIGDIIDDQMRKIGLTRNRAYARKLWRNKTHHIGLIARVFHPLKLSLVGGAW